MLFIETPTFTRAIKGLMPDDDYARFSLSWPRRRWWEM